MRDLDKTKCYYLRDLSKEQKDVLCKEAGTNESNRCNLDNYKYMCFSNKYNKWLYGSKPDFEVVNALELFYTLENVQVDCRGLSKGQIKDMCKVYEINGYKVDYSEIYIAGVYYFLRLSDSNGDVWVNYLDEKRQTITYDKFIELFSKEVKPLKEEKPQHYSKGIDTFKRMEENCTLEERLAFAKGNIDKYTWREKVQDKEDFEKIISYAKWAIKQLENE